MNSLCGKPNTEIHRECLIKTIEFIYNSFFPESQITLLKDRLAVETNLKL